MCHRPKPFRHSHFHMLASMYHTSSASTGESVWPWHVYYRCVPFLEFDQRIWSVLCQRLSGWVHFPGPPVHSPHWKAWYVRTEDQIKSTQLFLSATVRNLDPFTAEDAYARQTSQEAAGYDFHEIYLFIAQIWSPDSPFVGRCTVCVIDPFQSVYFSFSTHLHKGRITKEPIFSTKEMPQCHPLFSFLMIKCHQVPMELLLPQRLRIS